MGCHGSSLSAISSAVAERNCRVLCTYRVRGFYFPKKKAVSGKAEHYINVTFNIFVTEVDNGTF